MYNYNEKTGNFDTLFVKSPCCVKDAGEFQIACHVWATSYEMDLQEYNKGKLETLLDSDHVPTLEWEAKKEEIKSEIDAIEKYLNRLENALLEDGLKRDLHTDKPDQLVKAMCLCQKGHATSFSTVPGAIVDYLDKVSGYQTLFRDKGGTWTDDRKKRYKALKEGFAETFSKVFGASLYIKEGFKLSCPSWVLDELLVKLEFDRDKAIKAGACKVNALTRDVVGAKKFYKLFVMASMKAMGMYKKVERKTISKKPTC